VVTANFWHGRKVLITGATGFLGRHLVSTAVRSGAVVITTSRSEATTGAAMHVPMDLGDRVRLFAMVREIEPIAVLHVASAGVSGKAELGELMRTNVMGTDNLLAAASALPEAPAVVLAGSGYEYAPQSRNLTENDPVFPVSPYGISKAAASFCAGTYAGHMPVTLLRLFNIYGPCEREPRLLPYVVACAKAGRAVELTACEQVRDFVFVKDIAGLFWRALECPPQNGSLRTLNVGSDSPVPLKRFVIVLLEVLHEKGLDPRVQFGARPYRAGEPMYYAANPRHLLETLGELPPTTLEEGIRESVEAMI
jgi:nucleoside-diphosphate-sugar epimerase